jgi:molybdopterin/thiamine biosynthesis adenylyltransferase
MKVRFSSGDFKRMKESMQPPDIESFCYLATVPVDTSDGMMLLVKDVYTLSDGDYSSRSAGFVRPQPEYQKRVLKQILKAGNHPGLVHTHTFKSDGGVGLSGQDTSNFYLMSKALPTVNWADVVFDYDFETFDGEYFNPERNQTLPIEVIEVLGSETRFYDAPEKMFSEEYFGRRRHLPWKIVGEEHQRQTLIKGFDQTKLQRVKAGILGLGGNGAQLVQMLASMGVMEFVLADFDKVEQSNLSRIPYATSSDVGRYKVDVAVDYIIKKNHEAAIYTIAEGIESPKAQAEFRSCHIIFGCVDNAAARKTLNELIVACIIPYIDIGCEIIAENGVARPFGQCRTVLPKETPCLVCTNSINLNDLLLCQMSDEEKTARKAAGYIRGTDESPAAAIVQLNTGVASLAVQSLVDIVMGYKVKPYIYYDLLDMKMFAPEIKMNERCPVCGTDGLFAQGDVYSTGEEDISKSIPEVSHG